MVWSRYNSLGKRELPSNWDSIRVLVFRRDNWRCVLCGSGDNLQCDHIDGALDHQLENLQTLCRSCHGRKTAREAQEVRYGLRRGRRRVRFEQHPGMNDG